MAVACLKRRPTDLGLGLKIQSHGQAKYCTVPQHMEGRGTGVVLAPFGSSQANAPPLESPVCVCVSQSPGLGS